MELLDKAADPPTEPLLESSNDASMLQFHVAKIFEELDRRGDVPAGAIARLEWRLLPLLERSTRPPKALRFELSRDPGLFVQFLRVLYRPSADSGMEEQSADDPEQARLRALQAFQLFEGWDVIPGTRDDLTIDGARLEAWIEEARALAKAAGRLAVADLHIGKVLSASRQGADGHWPAEAVRDAIDCKWSKDLESGFNTGVYNRRGVTTRDPSDGGALERTEAARYRASADAVRRTHPRTGAVLDAIADRYEADAARHDERAAQRDWDD